MRRPEARQCAPRPDIDTRKEVFIPSRRANEQQARSVIHDEERLQGSDTPPLNRSRNIKPGRSSAATPPGSTPMLGREEEGEDSQGGGEARGGISHSNRLARCWPLRVVSKRGELREIDITGSEPAYTRSRRLGSLSPSVLPPPCEPLPLGDDRSRSAPRSSRQHGHRDARSQAARVEVLQPLREAPEEGRQGDGRREGGA